MSGLQTILELAGRELGTKESPAGSNHVKYNTAFYGHAVQGGAYPWCCVFLWWLFRQAGCSRLFYNGRRTASCGALAAWAKRQGRFVTENYRPGDLVFFQFTGKRIQHIGLVEKVLPGALTTIEGNTGAASDSNGGEVMRRVRPLRYAAGAFRPDYGAAEKEDDEVTQEQFNEMMERYLAARAKHAPGAYSAAARAWAEKNGILTGDSAGQKQYDSFCTREQAVVFLYRAAHEKDSGAKE